MHVLSSRSGHGKTIALVAAALVLLPAASFLHADAATSFASPLFQQQWQQGEALLTNFWGPLDLAHDGQREPYVEAPGGQRLVQYFDKARMELTNPANNTVTNGLLAVEMITGRMQLGDATFQPRPPAAIPVAGDPDNPGPTYATLQAAQAQVLASIASTPGAATTRALSPGGVVAVFPGGASFPLASIGGYDQTTGHNLATAFAAFRDRAGLATIGLAIAEPFWASVRVGGQPKDVLVQAFERRVLTYTPSNPAGFRVEMGNIGRHYFTWRYGIVSPTTPAPDNAASPPSTVSPCPDPASAVFVDPPAQVRAGVATAVNVRAFDRDGHVCGDGTLVEFQVQGTQTTIAGLTPNVEGCSRVVPAVRNGVASVTIVPGPAGTGGANRVDLRAFNPGPLPIILTGCLASGGIAPPYTPLIV